MRLAKMRTGTIHKLSPSGTRAACGSGDTGIVGARGGHSSTFTVIEGTAGQITCKKCLKRMAEEAAQRPAVGDRVETTEDIWMYMGGLEPSLMAKKGVVGTVFSVEDLDDPEWTTVWVDDRDDNDAEFAAHPSQLRVVEKAPQPETTAAETEQSAVIDLTADAPTVSAPAPEYTPTADYIPNRIRNLLSFLMVGRVESVTKTPQPYSYLVTFAHRVPMGVVHLIDGNPLKVVYVLRNELIVEVPESWLIPAQKPENAPILQNTKENPLNAADANTTPPALESAGELEQPSVDLTDEPNCYADMAMGEIDDEKRAMQRIEQDEARKYREFTNWLSEEGLTEVATPDDDERYARLAVEEDLTREIYRAADAEDSEPLTDEEQPSNLRAAAEKLVQHFGGDQPRMVESVTPLPSIITQIFAERDSIDPAIIAGDMVTADVPFGAWEDAPVRMPVVIDEKYIREEILFSTEYTYLYETGTPNVWQIEMPGRPDEVTRKLEGMGLRVHGAEEVSLDGQPYSYARFSVPTPSDWSDKDDTQELPTADDTRRTIISAADWREGGYGKMTCEGKCRVWRDDLLTDQQFEVEHVTQDDETGEWWLHLKGKPQPVPFGADKPCLLLVEWLDGVEADLLVSDPRPYYAPGGRPNGLLTDDAYIAWLMAEARKRGYDPAIQTRILQQRLEINLEVAADFRDYSDSLNRQLDAARNASENAHAAAEYQARWEQMKAELDTERQLRIEAQNQRDEARMLSEAQETLEWKRRAETAESILTDIRAALRMPEKGGDALTEVKALREDNDQMNPLIAALDEERQRNARLSTWTANVVISENNILRDAINAALKDMALINRPTLVGLLRKVVGRD